MKVSVRKLPEAWRKSPWMARYYAEGKPVCRFFTTREEAELYAKDTRNALKTGINPEDLAVAFRTVAGTGYSLSQLVESGLAHARMVSAQRASPTATFADGVKLVLKRAVNRRPKTLRGYQAIFAKLSRTFGNRVAVSITSAEVVTYLDSLRTHGGEPGSASVFTRDTLLRHFKMVLRILKIENPLPGVVVTKPRGRDIKFYSVAEVRTILRAALPSEKGLVALALFAGIRPETLERLPNDCVNVADRSIRIPGVKSKDHQPHFLETVPIGTEREVRPGPPEVLWDWLRTFPFQPKKWHLVQCRLKRALGGRWIQDGLRHTAATYYRARFGDVATAELLTHASVRLINLHYAGLVARAAADEFFALTVQAVGANLAPMPRRVQWPSDLELAAMLKDEPATTIAKRIGCSDTMIAKHCKLRGIPKPPRGA